MSNPTALVLAVRTYLRMLAKFYTTSHGQKLKALYAKEVAEIGYSYTYLDTETGLLNEEQVFGSAVCCYYGITEQELRDAVTDQYLADHAAGR